MTRRLRVAVIGAGIGAQHAEGYRALPDLFEVAVICDLDEARAATLAARAPGCAVATRYEAVLGRDDLDIVDICLPPLMHREAVLAALDAGLHVVCEKPLVASLAEVDELEAAAEAAERALLPVYQYRFGNGFRKLRHLIEPGLAGRSLVATLETHWNRGAAYYAVPWRGRLASELGGAVLGHAIHAHDLLVGALGPVRRLYAQTDVRVNAIETEDCAAVLFEMADGTPVTSSITLGSAEEISRLRFCFEHLTAENAGPDPYRPGAAPWRFVARDRDRQAAIDEALEAAPSGPEGFAGLFAGLHASLCEGAPLPVTVADARASLEIVTAIYHAARQGEPVDLPLDSSHPGYRGWLPNRLG